MLEHMIIADIAGQNDALKRLLARRPSEDCKVIFVGDLVDRGPDSKGVIETVRATPNAVVLMGNHEDMMVDFMRAGRQYHRQDWFNNGGLQTLMSYGITREMLEANTKTLAIRALAEEYIAEDTIKWLESLPLSYEDGELFVSHAPWVKNARFQMQLWNRDGPWDMDGKYQVFGHNAREEPLITTNAAAIDCSRASVLTAMLWPLKEIIQVPYVEIKGVASADRS